MESGRFHAVDISWGKLTTILDLGRMSFPFFLIRNGNGMESRLTDELNSSSMEILLRIFLRLLIQKFHFRSLSEKHLMVALLPVLC